MPAPSRSANSTFTYRAENEAATRRLGAALADVLPAGAVVSLEGTLGAGKTRLVQAIAEGCGVPRETVTSPTFVLCNEYNGSRMIYHFDAYRVNSVGEFADLGVEEYFDLGGLTLIEWGDRVAEILPPQRITIRVEVAGPEAREFTLTSGDRSFDPRAALSKRLVA